MGHKKGSPEREGYSDKSLPRRKRNTSNKQPNAIPSRTQGAATTQSKYKEGNNHDQSRIK